MRLFQLYILIWKNWILFKRSKVSCIGELVVPLVFVSILLILRLTIDTYEIKGEKENRKILNESFVLNSRRNKIYYYPNTSLAERLIKRTVNIIESDIKQKNRISYETTNVTNCSEIDYRINADLIAVVIFKHKPIQFEIQNNVEYSMCTIEDTEFKYNIKSTFPDSSEFLYNKAPEEACYEKKYFGLYNYFNYIKFAVDLSIIKEHTNVDMNSSIVKMQSLTCPSYVKDDLLGTFNFLLRLIITTAYLFTTLITIMFMLRENKTKQNEYYKLSGVRAVYVQISWLTRLLVFYSLITICIVTVTKLVFSTNSSVDVKVKPSKSILSNTPVEIVSMMLMVYSVHLALFTLLITQILQKIIIANIFMIIISFASLVDIYGLSLYSYLACVFPNTALTFALQVVLQYERSGEILSFEKLFISLYDEPKSLGGALAAMIGFSTIISVVLFFNIKKYFTVKSLVMHLFKRNMEENLIQKPLSSIGNSEFFENLNCKKPIISIENVSKGFVTGLFKRKTILKDVTLKFYKNEVTALVGHNGAGKSTLISLICGLQTQDKGTIVKANCADTISVCPQIDLFYDDLTVDENLKLMTVIKGFWRSNAVTSEIKRVTEFVALHNELKTKAKNLSGGKRRALSIALSIIGNSDILILDEPTQGLDQVNRRAIWELMVKLSEHKTVIFTTHYMDEVELLSDRIVFVSNGEIKCSGSLEYLKSSYSTKLTGNETVSSQLNMEDIFARINEVSQDEQSIMEENLQEPILIEPKLSGCRLIFCQMEQLLLKRLIIFHRRYIIAFMIICIPLLIQVMACYSLKRENELLSRLNGFSPAQAERELNINNYGKQTLVYTTNNYAIESLITEYYGQTKSDSVKLVRESSSDVDKFILSKRKANLRNLYKNFYAAIELSTTPDSHLNISAYYSTMAYHSSGSILNDISNILLAYHSRTPNKTIKTFNSPIQNTQTIQSVYSLLSCNDIIPVSVFNLLTSLNVAIIISLLVLHVSSEAIERSKILFFISGTHFSTYWLANYLFDLCLSYFTIAVLVFVLKLYGFDDVSEYPMYNYAVLILCASAVSWPMLAYIWSFMFKHEVTPFIVLFTVLGLGSFIDVFLAFLQLYGRISLSFSDSAISFIDSLRYLILLLFPNVTVKMGLSSLKIRHNDFCINSINYLFKTNYVRLPDRVCLNDSKLQIVALVSCIQLLIATIILICLETNVFHRKLVKLRGVGNIFKKLRFNKKLAISKMSLVYESTNYLNANTGKKALVIQDLTKRFGNRLVIDNLCISANYGECVGLLGLNGVGKSTLVKLLTRELKYESGFLLMNNQNIKNGYFMTMRGIGFCPQANYLPRNMTVKEFLRVFGKLKGLGNQSDMVVDEFISLFRLSHQSDKLIKNLSGGDQRKVSTAIAFIGSPRLIILDEPTAGVDILSKKIFWNLTLKAKQSGACVVLISHCMDECEVLCDKVAILAKEKLEYFDTLKNFKQLHKNQIALTIKLKRESTAEDIKVKQEIIEEELKRFRLQLKGNYYKKLSYLVTVNDQTDTGTVGLVKLMEKLKIDLNLEVYDVKSMTLEEIFINFIKS